MFNFINQLFSSRTLKRTKMQLPKTRMKIQTPPYVGQEYYIEESKETPFASKEPTCFSTILDIKEGWVQYKICRKNKETIFEPSARKISEFLNIYTPVK